ncbi:hypothetical protein [Curtobacterium sp. MCSS17_007]|uniref:hypothetical protein n=1 Tax=Curtobacterium sp. MCSS17_007 TaxID=2175646 RepID=UPI0011B38B2C|nr:hypothetical protein [Curtobacterium sp. MCSS17_007]WIE74476.1 hypothetical protein DEJ22_009290 [Curtobacterium sp. MCSS17_007]
MTRLDRTSENQLVERLHYLRQTLDDMKGLQSFGTSNFGVRWLRKKTADVTVFVPTGGAACVEVTVTPKSAISNPVIVIGIEAIDMVVGASPAIITPLKPVNGVQKWHAWIKSNRNKDEQVPYRFVFQSVSDATWTAVQIA